jgi:hypothetical protein
LTLLTICTTGLLTFLPVIHTVKYGSDISTFLEITASIIQGPVVGPAAYIVNAADLKAVMSGNGMCKYADDT